MSSDPPPKLLESEIFHLAEGMIRFEKRLDGIDAKLDEKLDSIQASVHAIELKLAEGKGAVRAYAVVVATMVGGAVSLAVSVLARALQ